MKLLEQIKKCANQFTYDFYLQCFPINGYEWQKSIFSNLSNNGNVISEQKIENDIKELKKIKKKIAPFVDRGIAHLDKRGVSATVTYKDLDDSLEVFDSIACKYIEFLTSKSCNSLRPTIQFNWQKIFTVPLDIRKFEQEN
ncbi:MAG: hypothetical protein DRG20_04425 [Deltaproteobacteria bacterium]|nr:MAG: hypothetical protein DRG20_04425 [Deltaproteobacteria bacterium]